MESTSSSATCGLPIVSPRAPEDTRPLELIVLVGFAIRIYLSLTNYCISGDGAAYIGMAREFDAGNWRAPLGAVFSPLYPLIMAGAHRVIADWEIAGNLISALFGTAAMLSVYWLTREVFGRGRVALGAAALTAIHPALAAYAASVRTEAGYICLTTTAVWLLLRAVRETHAAIALLAGLVAGTAYLYRTEAIGLIGLGAGWPLVVALGWRHLPLGWDHLSAAKGVVLGLVFAAAAAVLVVPYVFLLHAAIGSWSVGREFGAAIMFGLSGVAHDPAAWRRQAFDSALAPLQVLRHNPGLYAAMVRATLLVSFYNFVQAAGPVVLPILVIGLWQRGRRIVESPAEAFLALMVVFHFGGFAFLYTGPRFMIHLIPYTFGWVIIGLTAASDWFQRIAANHGWRTPSTAPALALGLILLPQTMWPLGYDMRGVRYAGTRIAATNHAGRAVVARDGRVAWYARARFVPLPSDPVANLCDWLATQDAGYLLIGEHDERRFAVVPAGACLQFLARYPRYGKSYYDLFAIQPAGTGR